MAAAAASVAGGQGMGATVAPLAFAQATAPPRRSGCILDLGHTVRCWQPALCPAMHDLRSP
jgi:hypothetical protein